MERRIVLGGLVLLLGVVCASGDEVVGREWWQHATFYQVYPRSFKDSDGDGVGDLPGITSKLPYLRSIGVNAIWLSPMFESPMVDNGYDVSDFEAIHHEFGTMADFDEMIAIAKDNGIQIMLDFVPNHSSDKHVWFEKSKNREEPYTDFYTWKDPVYVNDVRQPPNNWISVFGGAAWTFVEERQQYYLHQFYPEQPDLNYRNPLVVEEMSKVLEFWLSKGAAGFRLDAINHLFEDQSFPDELPSGWCNPNEYCYLDHIYTKDQPECYDMVYHFREVVDNYVLANNLEPKIIMTEAYASITDTMKYYQSEDGTKVGASMPFNFGIINGVDKDSSAKKIKEEIDYWMDHMPIGLTPNWVVGSHDHSRVATRFSPEKVRLFMAFIQTLPGVSITYYGDEIGMTDHEDFEVSDSRDPERTPMQWDSSTSAGFSSNPDTWLPVNPNYQDLNVENQQTGYTNLACFKELTTLRQQPAFVLGEFLVKVYNQNVLMILRTDAESGDFYVVALNFHGSTEQVNIKQAFGSITNVLEKVFSTASNEDIGDVLDPGFTFDLAPYEAQIYKTNSGQIIALSLSLIVGMLMQLFVKLLY